MTCATTVICGLTFGLGKKLAGSNTGVLRNWEVFFNHNKMVSDTSGRSKTKIFVQKSSSSRYKLECSATFDVTFSFLLFEIKKL